MAIDPDRDSQPRDVGSDHGSQQGQQRQRHLCEEGAVEQRTAREAWTAVATAMPSAGAPTRAPPASAASVPVVDLQEDMSLDSDDHHPASDTPAVLQRRSMDQAVEVFTRVVRALADMEGDFGRAPPPEDH